MKRINDVSNIKPHLILFVGGLSPPITGATVMSNTFIRSKISDIAEISAIDTVFIRKLSEMGHFTIRKVTLAVKYLILLIYHSISNKYDLTIFNPASRGWALIKDTIFVLIASKIFKQKVVLWMHGNGILDYSTRHHITKKMIDECMKASTAIVVPGHNIVDRFKHWVKLEKMHVIHHGIRPSIDPGKKANGLIKKKKINVLYFSNMHPEKGWRVLLNAALEILKVRKDIKFVFCGQWWGEGEKSYAESMVEKFKVQDNVKFLGATYDQLKARAFTEADIFVFPSFHLQETFGLVNIEAMEAGLPIIATAKGAVPEFVKDNINGYIIPERDSQAIVERVLYLADRPELRKEMGLANIKRFREYFTDDAFADRWITLIRGII